MSIITKVIWRVLPDNRKRNILKKQGLVIGTGCEILNGWNFGSEPYLVSIGDNVRITSGVSITTHDGGGSGCSDIYIPSFRILICLDVLRLVTTAISVWMR